MVDKFKMIASVYILFRDGDTFLLSRRYNTGYEDGNWSLVAGHVDEGESITAAAAREAKEESGVDIDPGDLVLKTTMHRRKDDIRMDFFFEPKKWTGELKNMEPDKCDDLQWFSATDLPSNTIPYIRQAIECSLRGQIYCEFGW